MATALRRLRPGPAWIVSGDVFTTCDYASLLPTAAAMARQPDPARGMEAARERDAHTGPAHACRVLHHVAGVGAGHHGHSAGERPRDAALGLAALREPFAKKTEGAGERARGLAGAQQREIGRCE